MPKPRIDYISIRKYILVMMYDAYVSDHHMSFNVARAQKQLPIRANVIQVCFNSLEADGFILENGRQKSVPYGVFGSRVTQEWQGHGSYDLTEEGRKEVEKMPDEAYDLCLAAIRSGAATGAYQELPVPNLPQLPDKWEPLPIEASDQRVSSIKAQLDEVISLIERDNGYRSEHPDERAEVLSAFGAARTMLLEASQFSYSALMAYVVWPLDRVLARFGKETMIGAAAWLLREGFKDWAKGKVGLGLDELFKSGK